MNPHRKVILGIGLLVAVLGAGLGAWAYAASCSQSAAYALYSGSYMDTMLNPAKAEDVEFFTQSGGVPNIMILLDNSGSMNRLPPNGPGFLGGSAPPAGKGYAGCGDSLTGIGTMLNAVKSRVYSSPCGIARSDPGVTAGPYDHSKDYAYEASACPSWQNGAKVLNGRNGFDPDWYCGTTATTCSNQNKVNYFPSEQVFHDAIVDTSTPAIPDGWGFKNGSPYLNPFANASALCSDLVSQGVLDTPDDCNTCLATKGWFYDGRLLSAKMDAIQVNGFPSLWYTGNYLNFFPPKFLVARKVLKDTIMEFAKVRAAMATFRGSGATILQNMNPTCDMPDSSWDSSRVKFMNSLDGVAFDTGTPLARALLDVGNYYHSPSLPWFGDPGWGGNNNPGDFQPSGADKTNRNKYAICYSCQVSSVIVVTDGVPKQTDDGCPGVGGPTPAWPSGTAPTTLALATATSATYAGDPKTGVAPDCTSGANGISTTDCPLCSYFGAAEDWKNNFTRVSWYLHNFDLRDNAELTRDCQNNGGRQTLDIYAIGFNNTFTPGAQQILDNAAKVGGGISASASNADEMRAALAMIQNIINTRATSFSVATLSTLQSQAGHSVIVPRFDPAKGPFWNGHLFRFELFSEFVNSCTPGGAGDIACDGCAGVFLQDKLGRFIQEDGNGAFKVNEPNMPSCNESNCALPSCTGPNCGSGKCGIAGTADAVPWWDSGALLASRSWKQRNVYTVVDSNDDGVIDARDATIQLAATDEVARQLIPYMNLVGTPVCSQLAEDIAFAGDVETRTAIVNDTTYVACAKEIIRFTLGADVLNSKNLSSPAYPPRSTTTSAVNRDLLRDRDWKLGDIFHSSPVVVDPPLPSDGVLCPRGLSRQCIPSLWATPVQQDVGSLSVGNAYDGYSKSSTYKTRRKMVLVGANDGMLHAFNGGKWLGDEDDPLTTGIDESLPPFSGYFERANSGDELWAFVPPDQIAKLHLMLGPTHNIFVDGTPMVRDVWVDGSHNKLRDSGTTVDDKKQPWEFHTVVVMNERRGGVHHFALDVTDAYRQPTESGYVAPKFLWLYPQPNDPRLLTSGEGYADFLPTAPPIGPVRVAADASTPALAATPTYVASTGDSVPYHERWVAFLAGGFDPQYLRGRGVHMVDVWTGKEIFDFSFPGSSCGSSSSDPRCGLRYPVPATVAMVQWGKSDKNTAAFANDGYFDTATFGDAGGQIWVLRFNDPATLSASTGLATNWFGARVFQMGGRGSPLLCTNEPFFYITANVAVPNDGALRVLAGTGDRYNLLDTYGGTCGPDNLRACIQRGCTVTLAGSSNRLTVADLGDRQSGLSASSCNATNYTDSLTSWTACTIDGKAKVVITCGNGASAPTTTKDRQFACSGGAAGYGCNVASGTIPSTGTTLSLSDASNVLPQNNKFVSIRVFEPSGNRALFTTATQATSYDGARLADSNLKQLDGAVTTFAAAALSTPTDNGWILTFNHAPSVTVGTATFAVSRPDERVSSASAVAGNCVLWNTSQPVVAVSASGNCDVSVCKQLNRRVHYLYGADVTTGGLCAVTPSLQYIRSTPAVALVPPPAPQYTVFINQKGQVQVGMTSVNTEIGGKNVPAGGAVDPAATLEFLDVPRRLHDCRHWDASGNSPNCK